ncbi:hypothetical protein A3H65_00125 [Candidatus Giovannonibacteria bacterium RIFCSPLOWO2_02_FULL_45_14]|uniref:Uncharacterized protein n=1 Tax=Candidatus Giovannonibacteria bacterium RIFCSPLOWO2_12_FULL_44_15 TaxID=1798364 RepID=A0A1F5Y0A6_9BACT|nr:MAG: hypothetical protein A3C75_00670 [Candidatus Giovannonibacteria bacterium RIFCSPHIGHO2_02_FULL_44_31]OGF76227.1 MAG: hypothetical protein A3E62_03790 [Candidatus Giovannonibacteria bacterium RIFCSPHIGHO2_12_FULL_44_29]OGF91124.1 MAG: hypothetical protein A3H65_00125 [Candidatus Giovannonibacteria bacterium RIFCSPLOWO2_02_FULL_45_14]OGF93584.1 MAG: hypothetical protein A3G54_03295 [Candidatus Giovannonibacteria bacterium RIFCSPLOWO2_12_FULL_44_15]
MGALALFWYFSLEGALKYEQTSDSVSSQQANLTENFSKAFIDKFGEKAVKGEDLSKISPEEISATSKEIIPFEKIVGVIPTVTKSDITILDENRPEAVKNYFNSLYGVYEKTFLTIEKDDIKILSEALSENNSSKLAQIDNVIESFDKSFEEVKKIPVPREWENFAVGELNYLLRSKKYVELIRNEDKDPLAALLALKERLLLMGEARSFHKKTAGDLLAAGIKFSPEEGGYKFFK